MPVADTLDQAARKRWDALARPGEEILLAAASDVAADGSYGARWLVITNQRVVVLPDGDVALENGKAATLLRLAPYLKPVWPLALTLAVATAGRTVVQLAPPYFQKLMIDGVLTPPAPGGPDKPHFG